MARIYEAIEGVLLPLGRRGENEALEVRVNIKQWIADYGNGAFGGLAQRYGEDEPYPVTITVNGDYACWLVTDVDTAIEGYGKFELDYIVGGVLAKSVVWRTKVQPSVAEPGPVPDPYESWVEEVLEAGAAALNMIPKVAGATAGNLPEFTADGSLADSGMPAETDPTLSLSGASADAKAVGDEITNLNEEVFDARYGLVHFNIIDGKYVNPTTGGYVTSAASKATDYISCRPNDLILVYASAASTNGAWYDSTKTRVAALSIPSGYSYITAPETAYFFATSSNGDSSVENLRVYSNIGSDLMEVTETVESIRDSKAHAIGTKDVKTGNLFISANATQGYYLKGKNGDPTENSSYGYSDYIPLDGDKYEYSANLQNNAIYFYNEDKSVLVPENRAVKDFALASTWPAGTKYCRFNFGLGSIDSTTFQTSVNTGYYVSSSQIVENVYNIPVGSTRDYTTLKAAVDYINSIADSDATYNILLDEGTYNALDGFTLETVPDNFVGLILPDHTDIFGQGDPANTIIAVDGTGFPENITPNDISTLNMYKNHHIKNVTIKSKNIRYGVHDDDSFRVNDAVSDAVQIFENVHFINEAKTITGIASYCMGIGAKKGQNFTFKNCWFENQDTTSCAFVAHNGTTAEKPVFYNFEACKITNNGNYGLRFTTTVYGQMDVVNICGCKTNKNIALDRKDGNTNTNTVFKFYGHGNSGMSFTAVEIVLNESDTEMML